METLGNVPVLLFETQTDWEVWIRKHVGDEIGLWLKIAKKASGKVSVNYSEALDVALCYGWIDGQKRSYDEQYFLQKFTPRRSKSLWSKINVEKIAVLEAAGRMKPAGLAAVAAAKADGRWEQAYSSPRTSVVPEDFQMALDANPKAEAFFATLNKTNRYAVLWRVQTTRTPAARQAKIEAMVAMLAEGKVFHP